jgi:Stage II sporulation protein E (SpoIIE)
VLKPNDCPARLLSRMFAFFAGALAVPVPLSTLGAASVGLVLAADALGMLFWAVFLHFFLVFPETSPVLRRWPRLERLLYAPAVVMALLVLAAYGVWLLEGPAVVHAWFDATPIERVVQAMAYGYVGTGLFALVLNYRQATRASKRRLRVIVAGSLGGFLPPLLVRAAFIFVDISDVPVWLLRALSASILLTLPLVPLSFAYAIVRHQVIPLRLIVRRGVRYLLVSRGFLLVEAAVVAAVLGFLLTGSRAQVLDELGGRADIVATVIAVAVVLFGLNAVHRRIKPAIDRRFFRDAYDAQRVLAEVGQAGRTAGTVEEVVTSLRSQAGSGDGSLTELVSSMNRLLYRSTERNAFATFFYALYDEQTRLLRYVNAGHNPPMLIRGRAGWPPPVVDAPEWRRRRGNGQLATHIGDAPVRSSRPLVGFADGEASPGATAVALASDDVPSSLWLRSGGLVIGAVDSTTYVEETLQLGAGDVLVAYTDGITEAFNPAWEEFGEQRLQETVVASLHLSARDLAEAVVERVHEWRGAAPQHDDITLMVAKVR